MEGDDKTSNGISFQSQGAWQQKDQL